MRINWFHILVVSFIGISALLFAGAKNTYAASTGYGWVMFESSSGAECNALTSHMVFRLYNESGASIPGNITVNGVSGGNVLDIGCQDPGSGFDVSASGAGYQNFSTLYRYLDSVVSSSKGKYLNTAVYLTNNLTTQITSPADGAVLTSNSVSFNFFANNLAEGGSQLDAYFYIDNNLMQDPPPVFNEGNFSMGPYNLANGNHTAMLIFVGKGGRLPVGAKATISFNVNGGGGGSPPPVTNTLNVQSTPVSGFTMTDGFGSGTTNYTRTSSSSIITDVTAPASQTIGGTTYNFQSWNFCNNDSVPDRICSVQVQNGATLTITANYSALVSPSPSPNPSITGRHVDTSGNLFNPAGKNITITGPTNNSSTANPFSFNPVSPGTYTVTATQVAGYTISVATCRNSTCNAGSTFGQGNTVSGLSLNPGDTADIWFKYTPAPSPTPTPIPPSPTSVPSAPPPGGLSTTNIQCNQFTANWSAVSGATQYRVEFTDTSPHLVSVGNVTSWTFWQDVIQPSHTYYWRVQAYVNGIYQAWSPLQTVNTPPCPSSSPVSPTPAPVGGNIFGYKWNSDTNKAFGTASGETPPGSVVKITNLSNGQVVLVDDQTSGIYFSTMLPAGQYRVEVQGVGGFDVQSCVWNSTVTSENTCTVFGPGGNARIVTLANTNISGQSGELNVWFYFKTPVTPPATSCVSLFDFTAYGGTRLDLTANSALLPASMNAKAESMALANGVSVILYEFGNYTGGKINIIRSTDSFTGINFDNGHALSNNARSVQVFGCEGIGGASPSPTPGASPSPVTSPSPSPGIPPLNPTNLLISLNDCSAVPTGPKVVFTWTHPAGSTANQYFIGVSTDNFVNDNNWGWQVVNAPSPGSQATYTWSSVTPMLRQSDGSSFVPLQTQAYYWRVMGYNSTTGQPSQMVYFNGNGNGGTINQAAATTFTTQNCTPPAEPTSLTVSMSCTGPVNSPMVKFSWNHPAGSTANTYYLDVSLDRTFPAGYGGATITDITNPHFDWSSAGQLAGNPASPVSGANYFWRVRAYNSLSGVYSTSHVYWNGLATGGTVTGTTFQAQATIITIGACGNDLDVSNDSVDPQSSVKLYKEDCVTESNSFNVGDNICAKVTTKNLGSTNSGNFNVGFYSGSPAVTLNACPAANSAPGAGFIKGPVNLPAGGVDVFTTPIFPAPAQGNYTAYGFADYDCKVPETNEANNLQAAPYVVGSKAFYITNAGDVASGNGTGGGGTLSLKADPGAGKNQSSYLLGGMTLTNVKSAKPWELRNYDKPFMPAVLQDYLFERFQGDARTANPRGSANPPSPCSISAADSGGTGTNKISHMFYCYSSANFSDSLSVPSGDTIWFINGDLNISANLQLANASDTLVLVVKGNITIQTNVERVDAILISGQQFQSATTGNMLGNALTVNGAVFAPNVNLNRTLTTGSDLNPSEIITLDPKYIIKLPAILGTPAITWEEIAP